MAIRTDMYSYRDPWQGPVSGSVSRGMQMGDMIDRKKKSERINKIFRQNMRKNPDGSVSFNRAELLSQIAGEDPSTAMQLQDRFQKEDAQKQSQEALIFSEVKTPQDYALARQALAQKGFDTRKYPENFDQSWIKQKVSQGIPTYLDKAKLEAGVNSQNDLLKLMALQQQQANADRKFGIDYATFQMKQDEYNRNKMPGNQRFGEKTQDLKAKNYVGLQNNYSDFNTQLELIQDARTAVEKNANETMFGTGPFATGFGMTGYLGGRDEQLKAKLSKVKIKNLINEMKGFAKSMDSNAERRAYDAKEATITNDDDTNTAILLGQESVMMKLIAEAKAQKEFVDNKGDLEGYKPVIDQLTTMVSPVGKLTLIRKSQKEAFRKNGFLELDEYANKVGKSPEPQEDTGSIRKKGSEIEWK